MKRLLLITLFFCGCAGGLGTAGILNTATGRPEIVIPGQTMESSTDAIADWYITHGFNIEMTTSYSMTGVRIADSTFAVHNFAQREEVSFNYAPTPSGIHIVGDFTSGIESYGTMDERSWLQNEMHSIAQKMSGH